MALTHRLQILLDEVRYERVAVVAAQRNMSVAAVIRDAIDRGLADPAAQRQSAASDILAAAPMQVPDVDVLKAELEDLRGRRG